MRFTRRFRATAGAVGVLGALAALTGELTLLAGALLLGAYLVGGAYTFVVGARRAADATEIAVTVSPTAVRTDAEATVTVTATRSGAETLPVTVECSLPVAANRVDGTPTVTCATGTDSTSVVLTVPVAGRFEVGPCRLEAVDPLGLFATTVAVEGTTELTVRPRGPREIHVGEGGQRLGRAYGDHEPDLGSAGIEPAELRQYVPGDPTSYIDWNATARLGEAYVREFVTQVERETLLAVDHRATMAVGPPGETKLDYGRELALAVVDSADALTDPLGLVTVGDEGETTRQEPTATDAGYRRARTRLADLTPTDGTGTGTRSELRDPGEARAVADRLAEDDSPFAAALGPLFADSGTYVRRVREAPLLEAVETALERRSRADLAVLVTDDTGRAELREAVRLLRRRDLRVVCYLLPDPLYKAAGLVGIETAYTAYLDFEAFRRDLARANGVTALEVAPADRLAAVLSTVRESGTGVNPR